MSKRDTEAEAFVYRASFSAAMAYALLGERDKHMPLWVLRRMAVMHRFVPAWRARMIRLGDSIEGIRETVRRDLREI